MRPEDLARVVRAGRQRPVLEPGPRTRAVEFGRGAIEQILPHRDPFLFVDAISAIDVEQCGVWAQRRIRTDDPVFAGHFPGHPIYPGVLQVETAGQTGLCALYFCTYATEDVQADLPRLNARALKMHDAVFVLEVHPGDELTMLARVLERDTYTATLVGQVCRGPDVCSLATMEAYLVDD